MSPMGGMLGMGTILLIPVLYAALKIVAGILVLHYGKRYAEKVKREEETMSAIFWGFFLCVSELQPDGERPRAEPAAPFVGYLLVMRGCRDMGEESPLFDPIRPFALGMAIYTGLLWLGDLLALTGQGSWLTVLLGLASLVVSLYISWSVVQAIRDMEARRAAELNTSPAPGLDGAGRGAGGLLGPGGAGVSAGTAGCDRGVWWASSGSWSPSGAAGKITRPCRP